MEIKYYLLLLKKWAWLLILGVILGTLAGYGYSKSQTPVYSSSTKILVVNSPQSQNSELAYLSQKELGETFIQLIKTSQVLSPASQKLGYGINSRQISASLIDGTQLISLRVDNTSPDHAAEIANTLVNVLIEQNEYLQSSRYKANEETLSAQLEQVQSEMNALQDEIEHLTTANVEEQIRQVETKIAELQTEIAQIEYQIELYTNQNRNYSPAPPELTAQLAQYRSTLALYQDIYSNLIILGEPAGNGSSDRLSYLQRTLDLYQQIYIQVLGDLEEVRLAHLQNTPNIVQIEQATVPRTPIRPQPLQLTLLGTTLGAMLAFGIAFAVEYMDETLRTPYDVEQNLGVPVLGYIANMKDVGEKRQVYSTAFPLSPVAEAFRKLRTTIDLSSEQPPKTILVTSSRSGEGKTTIATNLAAIYAQSGKRVILVDADLRRPAVHSAFGIPNRLGLATLLKSPLKIERIWKSFDTGNRKVMRIITCGHIPPNPAELLGSDEMLKLVAYLRRNADIVIFDSPPVIVADVQIMASIVDSVVVVLRPGKSPKGEAEETLTQLERSGANVMGVIFNRLPSSGNQGYGTYGYYSESAYSNYVKYSR